MSESKTQLYLLNCRELRELSKQWIAERIPKRFYKAEQINNEAERLRSMAAGLLLWHVLGINDEILRYNENGKPYCETGLWFNLSHSGEFACLATDAEEIGVDLMCDRALPHIESLAKRILTEREYAVYSQSVDPKQCMLAIWTCKESVLKAMGTGLSVSPAGVEVVPFDETEARIYGGATWYTKLLTEPDYHLAVTCRHPICAPQIHTVTMTELLTGR